MNAAQPAILELGITSRKKLGSCCCSFKRAKGRFRLLGFAVVGVGIKAWGIQGGELAVGFQDIGFTSEFRAE